MPKKGWIPPFKKTLQQWSAEHAKFGVEVTRQDAETKLYHCRCVEQGHEFTRVYMGNKSGCPKCAKVDRYSDVHRRLNSWLAREGLNPRINDRTLIPPKELDVYLPEHKIAIEVDGVYWHSDKFSKEEDTKRLIQSD